MLKISVDSLYFTNAEERSRNILLTNTQESICYIYKVKTNNLNVLEAMPNCGIIKSKTSLSLNIRGSLDPFDAKLLLIYAEIGEKPSDFNTEWSNLSESQFKSKQIKVSRLSMVTSKEDIANQMKVSQAKSLES